MPTDEQYTNERRMTPTELSEFRSLQAQAQNRGRPGNAGQFSGGFRQRSVSPGELLPSSPGVTLLPTRPGRPSFGSALSSPSPGDSVSVAAPYTEELHRVLCENVEMKQQVATLHASLTDAQSEAVHDRIASQRFEHESESLRSSRASDAKTFESICERRAEELRAAQHSEIAESDAAKQSQRQVEALRAKLAEVERHFRDATLLAAQAEDSIQAAELRAEENSERAKHSESTVSAPSLPLQVDIGTPRAERELAELRAENERLRTERQDANSTDPNNPIMAILRSMQEELSDIRAKQAEYDYWGLQTEELADAGGGANEGAAGQGQGPALEAPSVAQGPTQDHTLALVAQSLHTAPSRSNTKLDSFEFTFGSCENAHKLSDWFTSLRDYASARWPAPAPGESAIEKTITAAKAGHQAWLTKAPRERKKLEIEEPVLTEAERSISDQLTGDVAARVPKTVSSWAKRQATQRKSKRRLVDLIFKLLCACLPRDHSGVDAVRESLETPTKIRKVEMEIYLSEWYEKLERLEEIGIFRPEHDNYSKCLIALRSTIDDSQPNADFKHGLRDFSLKNPTPHLFVSRENFMLFFNEVESLAEVFYPAELAEKPTIPTAKLAYGDPKTPGKGPGGGQRDPKGAGKGAGCTLCIDGAKANHRSRECPHRGPDLSCEFCKSKGKPGKGHDVNACWFKYDKLAPPWFAKAKGKGKQKDKNSKNDQYTAPLGGAKAPAGGADTPP
jgi:hypothetical protein